MQGICKLCKTEGLLKESHFIPNFVGKWLKNTGITGKLRAISEVNKRVQDLAKEYWLCESCEGLFSAWESKFASKVFYPFVDNGESVIHYGEWMCKLCASLSWRTLSYVREKREFNEHIDGVDKAEEHLRLFLLGKESNLNQYEQHVFPLQKIESTNMTGLPPNINRYNLRAIAMDIICNSTDVYVYTKLPSFIILGIIKANIPKKMRSSRISLKNGTLSPRGYHCPIEIGRYIFEKAKVFGEAYDKISDKQKDKISECIRNNPDKAANSKTFEALMHDYDQFGKKVFRE